MVDGRGENGRGERGEERSRWQYGSRHSRVLTIIRVQHTPSVL